MRPILLGILSALFFACTFVLNRSMDLSGGNWMWSASLRYFYMIPFLLCIVLMRKNLKELWILMKDNPVEWLKWSFIGFGLFYAPLCLAAAYSPGWLIAGTWQLTIISGTLLSPLFTDTSSGRKGSIPVKQIFFSMIILLGVLLMQFDQVQNISIKNLFLGFFPVLIASFAYPLGNRKMMVVSSGKLDAFQRVLGMTIASLPIWLVLSLIALVNSGPPSVSQNSQSILVAIFSGVIATVLFFKATDMVSGNMQKLATVEATQSMEVLFALGGEYLLLSIIIPSSISLIGIFIVITGMILHSYGSIHRETEEMAGQEKEISK